MTFALQPTLRGELVHLRPLRKTDHEALFAVASDPLIWAQHPDPSRSSPEGFRRFFDGAMESGGAFLVTDAVTGAVIGSSRYAGLDLVASEVEIGWTFLARQYWGGRYNAEMKRLMLAHAFRFVDRVIFVVGVNNIRSRRAVERIGGTLLASHPAGRDDAVVYAIARRAP